MELESFTFDSPQDVKAIDDKLACVQCPCLLVRQICAVLHPSKFTKLSSTNYQLRVSISTVDQPSPLIINCDEKEFCVKLSSKEHSGHMMKNLMVRECIAAPQQDASVSIEFIHTHALRRHHGLAKCQIPLEKFRRQSNAVSGATARFNVEQAQGVVTSLKEQLESTGNPALEEQVKQAEKRLEAAQNDEVENRIKRESELMLECNDKRGVVLRLRYCENLNQVRLGLTDPAPKYRCNLDWPMGMDITKIVQVATPPTLSDTALKLLQEPLTSSNLPSSGGSTTVLPATIPAGVGCTRNLPPMVQPTSEPELAKGHSAPQVTQQPEVEVYTSADLDAVW